MLGAIKHDLLDQNGQYTKIKSTGLKPKGLHGAFKRNGLEYERMDCKSNCSHEDNVDIVLPNANEEALNAKDEYNMDDFQIPGFSDFWLARGETLDNREYGVRAKNMEEVLKISDILTNFWSDWRRRQAVVVKRII